MDHIFLGIGLAALIASVRLFSDGTHRLHVAEQLILATRQKKKQYEEQTMDFATQASGIAKEAEELKEEIKNLEATARQLERTLATKAKERDGKTQTSFKVDMDAA